MTENPPRARENRDGKGRDLTPPPAPEPLPYPVTDNHCHLDMADGQWQEPSAALAAAAAVGVNRIVQVGCDLVGSKWSVACAEAHPEIVAAVALHPNEAPLVAASGQLANQIAELRDLCQNDAVRAIGETGLDYFRTEPAGRAAQIESFRAHIQLAAEFNRTLMIHDRDAHQDVLKVLTETGFPSRWVMHCFSGDAEFAQQCVEQGGYLSFSGTVTFKNAEPLRTALRATPLERILVETDAPFLTPTPYRGRPNASYLIPHTVRMMAAVKEVELETFCRQLAANTAAAYAGEWG